MKKMLAALFVVLGGFSAFAEDPAILDTTAVTSTLTTLKGELSTWSASLVPILAAVAGAFLAIWLLKIAIRLVKSFGKA